MTDTARKRLLVGGAVAIALWSTALFVILPALIREVYAGVDKLPWISGTISGQAQHPVEYYQALARRAALLASAGLLLLAGAGTAAWWQRTRIASIWHAIVRSEPVVGAHGLLALGAWFGYLDGLAEVTSLLARFAILRDPREAPSWHALWMGPVSGALTGVLAAAVLAVLLRAWRGVSITVPVVIFVGFAAFSVVAGLRLGIHPWALVIFSLGLAVQLGRLSKRRGTSFVHLCVRSLPWMGGATVVAALAIGGANVARERFARRTTAPFNPGAPNVLLLILDTVRAEDMGLYGYALATTPEIERMAATGVTFEHAIATAPWTLPSHASLFTGVAPDRLSTDFDAPLDDAAPTLAEVLRGHGYATGGFVANLVFATRASGLDRGFATYRDHPLTLGHLASSSRWMRWAAGALLPALGVHGGLVHKSAAEVNREFLHWIPTDGRPFFAFLNYFDAHTPYKLEPPFDRKFRNPPPRFWRLEGWGRGHSNDELQEFRDAYDSAIAYSDAQVGALLRALEARGVLHNTLVVLVSDHGEHFGEHGGIMSHANSLYLPLLHVPLVMSWPEHVPSGRRVSSPVSTQDVAATILDVIAPAAGTPLPGHSLARHWAAADSAVPSPAGDTAAMLYSALGYNDFADRRDPVRRGPMQSLVQGGLHYIRNGDGVEEVYNYLVDPAERADLAHGADSVTLLMPFRQALARRAARAVARASGSPVFSATPRAGEAKWSAAHRQ